MDWEKQEMMRVLQGRPGTVYQESNDSEKQVYREWLKRMLQTGVTTVTFVKSDGSLRDMKATLDPVYVPDSAYQAMSPGTLTESNKKPRAQNDEVCRVWDTEAGAWRSFRYDRIKTISINLG
jgi:hypothetical protein